MNRWFFTGAALVLAAAVLGGAPRAHALTCDAVAGDDGDNTMIVGEVYQWVPALGGWFPITGSGTVGVCWTDEHGAWNLVITRCHGTTPAGDTLDISAGAGDDVVGVHPPSGDFFSCGMPTRSLAIGPWLPAWRLGVVTALGEGSDSFFGSPNADTTFSTDSFMGNDASDDRMCGYAGNDRLFGDLKDFDRECMSGGAGSDRCDGGTVSLPDVDRGLSCEALINASAGWNTACGTETSVCGTAPPDLTP
jgi:hypothetical protein